jgi:hypothetical protein
MLGELEFKVKLIKGWKVMILFFCGIFQYCFIKKLLKNKEENHAIVQNSKSRSKQQYSMI